MPKGQKHDEQDKRDAVSQFEGLGGTPDAAKQTASDYGVKATTIRKWARSVNSKKTPKRKTARKAVKASEEKVFDSLFNDFIQKRNAVQKALDDAQAAKKKLEAFVKGLK